MQIYKLQVKIIIIINEALVLSRLDYCHALLAVLPASSIKPLQLIQNTAARLIFNEPKRTHVTLLFINSCWLPIAAHIKFKALMFAYRTTSGSAPRYLNSLLQTYVPSRSLRSASERRITLPSQRGSVENSVLLKCRKLRREDQETSDSIVSRISLFYDMCCYLQSSKISS